MDSLHPDDLRLHLITHPPCDSRNMDQVLTLFVYFQRPPSAILVQALPLIHHGVHESRSDIR